jgi:hypothetical protein
MSGRARCSLPRGSAAKLERIFAEGDRRELAAGGLVGYAGDDRELVADA